MKNLEQIQSELTKALPGYKEKYSVKTLGVFGSFLRDEQHADSDVDILVTFEKKPSLFQFIELESELAELLDIKVDLVMETALKPGIREHVLKYLVNI